MTGQQHVADDEERWLKEIETYLAADAGRAPNDAAALLSTLEEAALRPSGEFRARLLGDLLAGRAARGPAKWPAGARQWLGLDGGFDMKRGLGLIVAVAIVVMVLAAAVVPSARADFMAVLRRIALGGSTDARQVEPLPGELPPGDYPWQLPEGTYWLVQTDIGNFGANVLPGESHEVQSVAGLDEAEALAGVRPLAPAEMPAGYALREVQVAPGRSQMFFQFYQGPGPDIVIVQTAVGISLNEATGTDAGASATVVSLATDGLLEEVTFDNRPAAWIDDHLLMWQDDGTTFQVGGLGLDLETAMAIGRSLR